MTVVPDAAFAVAAAAAAAALLIAEWLIENSGSPASDAGNGITPSGVVAGGPTHQRTG